MEDPRPAHMLGRGDARVPAGIQRAVAEHSALRGEAVEMPITVEIVPSADVVAVGGDGLQHRSVEGTLALVSALLDVDDGAWLEPIEPALAGDPVLVDPENRHLGYASLEGTGEMRIERDAGRGLAHLAHRVRLEHL